MTREEYDRIQAEAAASGHVVFIEATVTGPHPGIADRIAECLIPWAYPEPEAEL